MIKQAMIGLIRFYQRFLSPLKRVPTCRYLPTCSSYAIEAIERRGILVGSLKAMWRLLRCNPFVPGGYDPVDPAARSGARARSDQAAARSEEEAAPAHCCAAGLPGGGDVQRSTFPGHATTHSGPVAEPSSPRLSANV